MSGDSEVGNGTFQMSGGKLTSGNGGIFYTTNTESTLTLENIEIEYADDSEFFLQCTGNNNARGRGKSGDNGAYYLFTGISQTTGRTMQQSRRKKNSLQITRNKTLQGWRFHDTKDAHLAKKKLAVNSTAKARRCATNAHFIHVCASAAELCPRTEPDIGQCIRLRKLKQKYIEKIHFRLFGDSAGRQPRRD